MPTIEFLCGCITGNVESRVNIATMDSIIVDDEGMLTCTIHHERRKNWRSLPWYTTEKGVIEETWLLGYTHADWEGFELFAEPPVHKSYGAIESIQEDVRNTYDPESVGIYILTRANQKMSATSFLNANRHRELGK